MPDENGVPKYDELFNVVLDALRALGGSATVAEMEEYVSANLDVPSTVLEIPSTAHPSKTVVMYRLAWARSYLKDFGVITNSQRGVWTLTEKAKQYPNVDSQEVRRVCVAIGKDRRSRKRATVTGDDETSLEAVEAQDDWQQTLIDTIIEKVSPSGFERLIQRMLRESGFTQVQVTGRSGDGGIDGKGIAKIHGFMSFHVVFQAKKYRGSVTASQVRDFRGAMIGKGDKGLLITTGTFTKDARAEASRDGATPIDLIDGEALALKLKELGLGVLTQLVEKVEVQADWFAAFAD